MKRIFFLGFLFLIQTTLQGQETTVTATSGKKVVVNADASASKKGVISLQGDLTGSAIEPVIKDDAITTAKIKDGAINSSKLGVGSVITNAIVNDAITGLKIEAGAVDLATKVSGVLSISRGGTGSGTASGALSNLGAESLTNKTTTISPTPDDVKYPTEKAIKTYVDSRSGGIYTGSGFLRPNTETFANLNGGNLYFQSKIGDPKINTFSVDDNLFSVDALNDRVGIGTTFPREKLHLVQTGTKAQLQVETANGGSGWFGIHEAYLIIASQFNDIIFRTGSELAQGASAFAGVDTGIERLKIKNNGELVINGATAKGNSNLTLNAVAPDASNAGGVTGITITSTKNISNIVASFMQFRSPNDLNIGSITTNNNTSVSFNTNSDYRLKEDFKSFDGLAIINQIPIYDYKWKSNESRMHGVKAHELQAVVPYAVNGIKDAVNADGTIDPQQVDYSKLTAVAVKAIQEVDEKVAALQNLNATFEQQRVAALEKAVQELQLLIKK
jgi:hypothetical protein